VQQRLQQRLRAMREGQGGFTLIELLIVIVILGVLAGIVVFSVQFITDRGNKAACQTDVKNVQTAVEAYYAQATAYPTTFDALIPKYIKGSPDPTHNITINATTGEVTGSC
jgi:prepilin-type N-terminal cleavage/methylation domain-containing protein